MNATQATTPMSTRAHGGNPLPVTKPSMLPAAMNMVIRPMTTVMARRP